MNRSMNWRSLNTLAQWVVEESVRVQQIPAPTFHEDQRAAYVGQQFEALGLEEIQIDAAKNVYGLLKGSNRAVPAVMVAAHTDTVFSAETDLTIRYQDDWIYGPGLGDNSMGVAGLLGLARWLHDENFTPECDIWFVATSCEEGLGDLKGMRAAYELLKHRIGIVINLEGLAFGHIYHAGIAVHRMHITAEAEGGHSWLHFGRPSAVHSIMELGAQISRMSVPT
ncbi:MAG: M20/M25/M40 family metallo-hydrolase, partial [Anaerolineae bacterium]|nr:M20/M25/M40 family metallo-hydrolase [Anaerolineae bacterium]